MTVQNLRAMLKDLPDDMIVLLGERDPEFGEAYLPIVVAQASVVEVHCDLWVGHDPTEDDAEEAVPVLAIYRDL